MMRTLAIFAVAVVCLSTAAYGMVPNGHCLNCICEAASRCNLNEGCHWSLGREYCGPYHISFAYWRRAGNRGFRNDYLKCVLSKRCSETTIKNFMRQHSSDCDGDRIRDCDDFALVHKLGENGCDFARSMLRSSNPYWANYRRCARRR